MTHAYSSWVTNLGTLIMWWKSLAISFSTIMFHGDLLFLHMCTSPAQVNLERRCSTRYEGDDDSRKLATRGRSSLVSSWWAVSLSWARHGQTAGACQLEVLQQGKRRSTENLYYLKAVTWMGYHRPFKQGKRYKKRVPPDSSQILWTTPLSLTLHHDHCYDSHSQLHCFSCQDVSFFFFVLGVRGNDCRSRPLRRCSVEWPVFQGVRPSIEAVSRGERWSGFFFIWRGVHRGILAECTATCVCTLCTLSIVYDNLFSQHVLVPPNLEGLDF